MFAPRYFGPRYFPPRYFPPGGGGTLPGDPGVILGGFEYTGLARDFMHGANVVDLMTMSSVQVNTHSGQVKAHTHGAGVSDIMHGANVVDEAHGSTVRPEDYMSSDQSGEYGSSVRDRNPEAE